ncbi:MAG: DUF4097 family beta strand repeat-containing protein [Acidobacteria bacterium]|nr:DUF4097 family beta strand repeat-containing protein [Acidobacteriota bacterium]
MRLNRYFVCALVAASATVDAVTLRAAVQRSATDFRWHGALAAGQSIEIKGVNGDVTAGAATGNEVEVTAVRRGERSDPEGVRLDVVPHGGGVTICAVYPSPEGRSPNECRPGSEGRMNTQNNDVRVKFTVRVPHGVRFIGRTVNGDIEAASLTGPVSIKTVNGSASFSTSSYGDAATVNGSVKAALGSSDWTEELDFSTVNGTITVELPADTSADVRASTVNGDISTDFPLTVTGRVSPRRLNGTIGAGGRGLSIETVNGSVQLRRR